MVEIFKETCSCWDTFDKRKVFFNQLATYIHIGNKIQHTPTHTHTHTHLHAHTHTHTPPPAAIIPCIYTCADFVVPYISSSSSCLLLLLQTLDLSAYCLLLQTLDLSASCLLLQTLDLHFLLTLLDWPTLLLPSLSIAACSRLLLLFPASAIASLTNRT